LNNPFVPPDTELSAIRMPFSATKLGFLPSMQQPLYQSFGSNKRTLETTKHKEKYWSKKKLTIIVMWRGHKAARRLLFGKARQSLPYMETVATVLAANG
jgi:hypothetical protein